MGMLMRVVFVSMALFMTISGCTESILDSKSEFTRDDQRPFDEVQKRALSVTTLVQDVFSNNGSEELVIARNEGELQSLYEKIYAPGTRVNIPAIDFTRSMVIGCFMGEQSGGGYSVEIKSISASDDTLYVDALYMVPAPGQAVIAVMTQPVHVVVTERSGLPVVFTYSRKAGKDVRQLNLRSLLRGEISEISEKRQLVIRDEEKLGMLLSEMGDDALRLPFANAEGIQEVDFKREMVIAVFRGAATSTPRYIQIESVWLENGTLNVYVENLDDPREILKKSSPFHLVIVEKSDHPVQFTESEREIEVSPPDSGGDAAVFMSFTQEGGIAGFNRTLTIYTDWTAELTDKAGQTSVRGYLSRTDVRILGEILAAKDFFSYEEQYGKPGAVTDQMTRTIFYVSAAGKKSVSILDDTGSTPPEELLKLERYLSEILGNILKQNTK